MNAHAGLLLYSTGHQAWISQVPVLFKHKPVLIPNREREQRVGRLCGEAERELQKWKDTERHNEMCNIKEWRYQDNILYCFIIQIINQKMEKLRINPNKQSDFYMAKVKWAPLTMTCCYRLPLHAVIISFASSIWHLGTLLEAWLKKNLFIFFTMTFLLS